MQVLVAGSRKLLFLELEAQVIEGIARQLGFEMTIISDGPRVLTVELRATDRRAPLLLFDAADPGNLGWFSRCQFYIDGATGMVLQTPVRVANMRDASGKPLKHALRLQIDKELPEKFRIPGKQTMNEQAVYAILFNLLTALNEVGVAVCGGSIVKPLSGRTSSPRSRT